MDFVYLDGPLLNQQVKLFCLCMEEGTHISKFFDPLALKKTDCPCDSIKNSATNDLPWYKYREHWGYMNKSLLFPFL